jgi:hypothetical protein
LRLLFAALMGVSVSAFAANLCEGAAAGRGVSLAYFNGINTTKMGAIGAMLELREAVGSRTTAGERITYELMYNHRTRFFTDARELFDQRVIALSGMADLSGRYELFFGAYRVGRWWDAISGIRPRGEIAGLLEDYRTRITAAAGQFIATIAEYRPPMADYAEHRTRVRNWILEGKKIMFVSHSRGAPFLNAAYDYAKSTLTSEEDRRSLGAYYIASTTSRTGGWDHALADKDEIINALRAAGTELLPHTHTIPGGFNNPPDAFGNRDPLGHGLIEIYLNPSLPIRDAIKTQITTTINRLVAPETAQASSGFFTVTLTWDGEGDVDLRIFEPGGVKVYDMGKQGESGYLDVDNTEANGPEHYFATCDSDKLQTGFYAIGLSNYAGADGRTATVQVASWNDGVLGTSQITLGPPMGDNTWPLFGVLVSRDSNGRYSASLGPILIESVDQATPLLVLNGSPR